MRKCVLHVSCAIMIFLFYGSKTIAQQENIIRNKYSIPERKQLSGELGSKLDNFNVQMYSVASKLIRKCKKLYASLPGLEEVDSLVIAGKSGLFYNSYLDTLETSLKFIDKLNIPDRFALKGIEPLTQSIGKAKINIEESEAIMGYLRKQLAFLEAGKNEMSRKVAREVQKIKKELARSSEKFRDIQSVLTEKGKLEKKLCEALRETTAFADFFEKYSLTGGLFAIKKAGSDNLDGLQTRADVQLAIKEKCQFSGVDGKSLLSAQIQAAKNKLAQMRGEYSSPDQSAEFNGLNLNTIRSKTFLQRVEFGTNIKFSKATNMFPVRSEVMILMGYRISDNSSAGIGVTHWLGLGSGFNNISLTHQGLGLNSYVKVKMTHGFYLQSGWEQNYFSRYLLPGSTLTASNRKNSALLGLSKQTNIGKSFLKGKWGKDRKGGSTISLLYDFLYRQALPKTEAVKLRFGYIF